MTAKRIIALIILVPVAVILIAFIVANRALVTLALNPFNVEGGLSFTAPFFVWLFVFLVTGIVIGGATVWVTQSRYRKALRETRETLAAERAQSHKGQDFLPGS